MKYLILILITGIILFKVLIEKFKEEWRTFKCKINLKHTYRKSNAGINKKFTSLGMSYYKCVYCNRFKVNHQLPVPDSYIRELLKQKRIYDLTAYERYVLVEKLNYLIKEKSSI